MATTTRMAAELHQVLDPRTLGRPVHLLGKFTGLLRAELSELFHTQLNRRYRAHFEIGAVSLDAAAPSPGPRRWRSFGASAGRFNFALDRSLLLCILGYRYGTHASLKSAAPDGVSAQPAAEPETATEERLAARLGLKLVQLVAARINALQSGASQPGTAPAQSTPDEEFTEIASTSLDGAWTLHVKVTERSCNVDGNLWLRLEEGWIARLLRALAPTRERGKFPSAVAAQPLPTRLQLTLIARLLEKQMTLGSLVDLRVGDVVPITLGTTDVLIGDSHLFTASLAEHQGKLCLTSFQDVE